VAKSEENICFPIQRFLGLSGTVHRYTHNGLKLDNGEHAGEVRFVSSRVACFIQVFGEYFRSLN
jgi:hypothetical protein